MHTHVYVCMHTYVYIYIYIERERKICAQLDLCINDIYLYIHICT